MEHIVNIIKGHQGTIAILSGLSIVIFFLSLLTLPWMVCRIPEDYFLDSYLSGKRQKSMMVRVVIVLVRNIVGAGLLLIGFIFLFMPGQGLITMFLGVVVMTFPGKKKLVQRVCTMEKIQTSLNWIRKIRQVNPLRFEDV